ncbi:MAG TPA: hypothetical protein VHY79_06880, partial [Rhizomicrobium sp.]|nr:hypothetical protein [Rhizomicrobium sp.]
FDAAASHGFPVLALAPGVYRVSRPLRIQHPLALVGGGAYDINASLPGCAIVSAGFAAPVLTVEPVGADRLRGFTISGILFDCGGRGSGISFRRCADFALTRVGVRAAQGFGMEFRNSWDAVVIDAFVSRCGLAVPATGAIAIAGETFADNSNSLHFFGARVESSHGPSLIIQPPLLHSGPNNNIQFVASKFHLPAGDGSTPPASNLVLNAAEAVSFHGTQIFDAGSGFPVLDFGGDSGGRDTGYSFFGCDIDIRAGDALIGGDLVAGHRFFGCTLRADPAASHPKQLYRGISNLLQRIKDLNTVYRLTS